MKQESVQSKRKRNRGDHVFDNKHTSVEYCACVLWCLPKTDHPFSSFLLVVSCIQDMYMQHVWFKLQITKPSYQIKPYKTGYQAIPGILNKNELLNFLWPLNLSFLVTFWNLYTVVERRTVRVKCLTQEHNTIILPQPELQPWLLNVESSALTTTPQLLLSHVILICLFIGFSCNIELLLW